jgi:hypothetical protein
MDAAHDFSSWETCKFKKEFIVKNLPKIVGCAFLPKQDKWIWAEQDSNRSCQINTLTVH